MDSLSPLLVPLDVHALVVDAAVFGDGTQTFRRWQMNYSVLSDFLSPEPQPFNANDDAFKQNTANQGVYVYWELPEALRHGTQDATGALVYPLVPNRWLVVRFCTPDPSAPTTRHATAWVVESDYLDPTGGTVPFLDPTAPAPMRTDGTYAPAPTRTLLGRRFDLDDGAWTETGTTPLFLQAIGPANPLLAAYQPHNRNVFSLFDDLATEGVDEGTMSYLVLGWYSDASQDPLAGATDAQAYAALLDALQWITVGEDEDAFATSTLYHGMALGIGWDQANPVPPASPRDDVQPTVSVGNTSIDAFTAWLEVNLPDAPVDPVWLEAMQYNLLDVYDQPDGQTVLYQRIHEAWFGSAPGGTQWTLVSEDLDAGDDLPPPLSASEKAWLDALNTTQYTLDQAQWDLYALQQQLYEMWWKNGFAIGFFTLFGTYPYALAASDFAAALDPATSTSLTAQVNAAMQTIAALEAGVPHRTATEQTMDEAIGVFLQAAIEAGAVSAGRLLKALAKPRFWQATDPVVLINGVQHDDNIDPYAPLRCRAPDQLVAAIEVDYDGGQTVTAAAVQPYVPQAPNLGSVASVLNARLADPTLVPGGDLTAALLNEFFLLDPANAGLIAANQFQTTTTSDIEALAASMTAVKANYYDALESTGTQTVVTGVLPAAYAPAASPPWLPLFLEWEVYWYPIPFEAKGTAYWQYNGDAYALTQLPEPLPFPKAIEGRSILTPKTAFDFKSRVEQYLHSHPDVEGGDEAALLAAIDAINGWDFLSQTLSGFTEQVGWRDPASNLAPDDTTPLFADPLTMSDLVGDHHHAVPQSRLVRPPTGATPPSMFEGLRAGQFFFHRLTLVDQFGQSVEIVEPTTSAGFIVTPAPGVVPDLPLKPSTPERFVQLPPRLLQAARLNFDYVDPASTAPDPAPLFLNSDLDPVAGWLLPNHLDGGLSVYAPDGTSLAELGLATDATGTQAVVWQPAPGIAYATPAALTADYPLLAAVCGALDALSADAFTAFLTAIDETLWTVDPLGERYDENLSVLVGRPLAVVRARLAFALQRDPLWDPSWPYTFAPPTPPFVGYDFPVRLGDQAHYKDGLLGYFLGTDYGTFHAVHDPNPTPGAFLQPITPETYPALRFDDATDIFVTMLVDPRANVYAQTDVLPARPLTLNQRYVDAALAQMALTFRTGPCLTTISTALDDGGTETPTIRMPLPAERNGTWTWMERAGTDWNEVALTPPDTTAHLSNVAPTLREGLLKLTNALSTEETEENGS